MTIDPISLPEFPLGGLAMEPHMAAIQAWGMACAKVGAVGALGEAMNECYGVAGGADAAENVERRDTADELYENIRRLRDQLSGKTNEGSGG